MNFSVRIGAADAAPMALDLERDSAPAVAGDAWRVALGDRSFTIDAVEVAPGVYSILANGCAFEARVSPQPGGAVLVQCRGRSFSVEVRDPRAWRAGGASLLAAHGRQQVLAPMPGKVVRVLARDGESVEANQGLVVIEAMKMQNEIRAPKSGTLERVLVSEGQAVAAGQALAIVV
jgi:biotin carboxyl carrier protein